MSLTRSAQRSSWARCSASRRPRTASSTSGMMGMRSQSSARALRAAGLARPWPRRCSSASKPRGAAAFEVSRLASARAAWKQVAVAWRRKPHLHLQACWGRRGGAGYSRAHGRCFDELRLLRCQRTGLGDVGLDLVGAGDEQLLADGADRHAEEVAHGADGHQALQGVGWVARGGPAAQWGRQDALGHPGPDGPVLEARCGGEVCESRFGEHAA
jgi:hypothetical protein